MTSKQDWALKRALLTGMSFHAVRSRFQKQLFQAGLPGHPHECNTMHRFIYFVHLWHWFISFCHEQCSLKTLKLEISFVACVWLLTEVRFDRSFAFVDQHLTALIKQPEIVMLWIGPRRLVSYYFWITGQILKMNKIIQSLVHSTFSEIGYSVAMSQGGNEGSRKN